MAAGLRARWARILPERYIVYRGSRGARQVRLSPATQLVCLAALCGGLAVIGQLATGYLAFDRLVAAKEAEAVEAEMSNAELRNLVIRLQARLHTAQDRLSPSMAASDRMRGELYTTEMRLREVEAARDRALGQRDEASAKAAAEEEVVAARNGQIARLGRTLEAVRGELRQVDAQRSATAARLARAEGELPTTKTRLDQTRAAADMAERARLAQIADDRLRPAVAAFPTPTLVSDAIEKGRAAGGDPARHGWGEVERLLTSAGVDIDRFMARFGAARTFQGGPFVALDPRKQRPAPGEVAPETMESMLGSLPLAAPLAEYQLESRFGARLDPLNGQRSMHTGLDLSAPFRSRVYNTAPGVVVHAGSRGEYGKVVEIDHGSGIVTRYAHLHRVSVVVGQRITGRQQIALLGSTGRSTGPHVHYEILVNGVPQNPERFLKVGKTTLAAVK
jgi:murein DD-endopeptidase MepM/ murein hydrolase activator NlpD